MTDEVQRRLATFDGEARVVLDDLITLIRTKPFSFPVQIEEQQIRAVALARDVAMMLDMPVMEFWYIARGEPIEIIFLRYVDEDARADFCEY